LVYVADAASLIILSFQPTDVEEEEGQLLIWQSIRLYQNRPNPFNDLTTIHFQVGGPEDGSEALITLKIYNIRGQLVRTLVNERLGSGAHQATWDGKNALGLPVESGIYLCALQAGPQRDHRKLVLLR